MSASGPSGPLVLLIRKSLAVCSIVTLKVTYMVQSKILGTLKKDLIEMVLLSTHNICFG